MDLENLTLKNINKRKDALSPSVFFYKECIGEKGGDYFRCECGAKVAPKEFEEV